MGVAAAIGGAAVVGAIASDRASSKAAKAQQGAADTSSAQVQKATNQARDDLFNLFPAAQQSTQQGYQGALDVFRQTIPQQSNVFQSGNVAAQNQLLAGLPQYQNAILGAPVDYSQFQATQLQQPNFDFTSQQLVSNDPYAQQASTDPFAGQSLAGLLGGGGISMDQYLNAGGGQGFDRKFGWSKL